MLSGMPVGMLNRMLSRMLNTECLMKYLVEYLVECPVECSVKSTLQLHEQTQALYRRFGISGEHPPEPPGPANASFISKIWHVRGTPPWTPRSERMLSEMLSEMPSRMLNEMISEMFDEMHNRMLSRMLDEIPCRMPSRVLDSSKADKRKTVNTMTTCSTRL